MKKNIVYKGDCLDLMPKYVEDNSIDLILADLPYGTTNCKWDSIIPLDLLWKEYKRIAKPSAAILLFAQTPFDKILGFSNISMLKYEWVWEKTSATGFLNANKMPMKAHENILVFYKKLPTYNAQKTTGHTPVNSYTKKHNSDGPVYGNTISISGGGSTERYPRSVLRFSSDKQTNSLHPTQKPLALVEYFVNTYSNRGNLVLDNVAGSGTTGLACKNLGRNYILMEKEERYYNICLDRLK